MLKNEWKHLVKNKLMLIVVIAVITIPTIYTTLFLGSMWDPYGNVDQLPVAVVNNDRPVDYEGETLNVGQEMVDQLKDDGSLDFRFVDGEDARQGQRRTVKPHTGARHSGGEAAGMGQNAVTERISSRVARSEEHTSELQSQR